MAKLVLTTWAACFARQNPVSTSAKPACMKITSTAPITIHSRFRPISPWVSLLATVPPPSVELAQAVPLVSHRMAAVHAASATPPRRIGCNEVPPRLGLVPT